MFKKIIAITLCVLMLPVMTVTCVSAQPLTTSAGIEALRDQFLDGTGPSVNGLVIDYCYYAPDKEYMTDKYPLVIWLHGLVSGGYPRRQITKNDISNWSALEFQYRFPQGGAFILAPRSPEVVADWADNLIEPLKATIDDFIQQHYDMIDPTRIYIGGLSMGGKMTLKMVANYPGMFAAAFPCSPYCTVSDSLAKGCRNTPIWQLSSKSDYLMSFSSWIKPSWEKLMSASNRRSDCRWTVMDKPLRPDGSATGTTHDTWYAATFDMFMNDKTEFTGSITYDGNGNRVKLTYPNGMISWLSRFSTSYSVSPKNQSGSESLIVRLYKSFMAVIARIVNALGLRGILG